MKNEKKNPLVYVIGGFRTAHRIQSCSTSRNPHLDSALDAPEFIPGWIGWGLYSKKILEGEGKIMSAEGYGKRYRGRAVIGCFAGCGVIVGFIILLIFAKFFLAGFFLLSISSFIFSLIGMDAMTYYARKEIKTAYDISQDEDKQKEFLKTLPLADRIAIIHPEPVGVFDHHEIRRSLTISLTIVYFTLLSLSVFKSDLLIKGNPMVELFTWIYLAVIAFYFGSRGLEKYAEVRIGKEVEEIGEIKKKVDDIKEDLKKDKGKKTEQISETLEKIAKTKAFKDKPGEILDFLTGLEIGMEKASSIKKFLKELLGKEIWKELFEKTPEKEEEVSQNDIDRFPSKG